jgi:hypothetical protein
VDRMDFSGWNARGRGLVDLAAVQGGAETAEHGDAKRAA